jgi:hypothetical protein
MESETGREESRENEIKELREDAALLEVEAVGIATAAAVLEAEADHLEDEEHQIHFKVDGDPFETTKRTLRANAILRIAGLDSALRYLDEISPEQRSFKDKGEEEIHMINHMEFISLRVGPTPVS